MGDFAWAYLPGSYLKSRLTYPNGATAVWEYEPKRDLLARVTNTINGTVASQYTYTNDLLGRRTGIGKSGSMMAADETQPYGYNVRDELISGQNQTYAYDDIGNRTAAEGKTYVANNLNQYTAIDDFVPEYDADGNQTLIKTETGVWSVVYNAENRPVRWESGEAVITMAFDRLGRRVDYCETRAGQAVTHIRFVYDNFLCVQRLDAANGNAVRTEFVWDPTESIATRPLVMRAKNWGLNLFYTHDGNKNVSEVFYHALQDGIAAHYDYAPFGAVTRTARATRVTNRDLITENPFRFSSEYHDHILGLVYYNYRHYDPSDGRWMTIDRILDWAKYRFCDDNPIVRIDYLGDLWAPTLVFYEIVELPRLSLHEKRYGKDNVNGKNHPLAFTTISPVETSPTCTCNPLLNMWEGTLSATITITTYIYDNTYDDRNAVAIYLDPGLVTKGTREDVLRHEKAHADDFKAMFEEVFASLPFRGLFKTEQACNQEIGALEKSLLDAFHAKTAAYGATGGHDDPKFQPNGEFYATGIFK